MRPRSIAWLASFVLAACGGYGSALPSAKAPLSVREQRVFDDGVDLLANPEVLQDQWKADWDRDLHDRIEASDLIVLGAVSNLRTDVDPGGTKTFSLAFGIERVLQGSAPGGELNLQSRNGAQGYASIGEHAEELLQRRMVAFVKYALSEDGTTVAHFHLVLPSKSIETSISDHAAKMHPVIVIERNN